MKTLVLVLLMAIIGISFVMSAPANDDYSPEKTNELLTIMQGNKNKKNWIKVP